MRNIYILIFSLVISAIFAGNIEKSSIITQDLQQYLEQKSDNDLIRVNLRFKDQLNLNILHAKLRVMPGDIKRQFVVNELKQFSKNTQKDLKTFLSQQPSTDYKLLYDFWLSNVITCYVCESLIKQLAQRDDLDRIDIDEERQLILEQTKPKPFIPGNKEMDEITYNILKVNADDVWALGYTGEGVIVSVIDAGVNYNHVDLADHMWEDADYPFHGYDFFNNDNDPMDCLGHGTHCAGTVAGDGTAGSQTGMAPDATIMACKVLSDNGGIAYESSVWAAIEFSVEQGAHVISMSLGWLHSWNPDRPTWRNILDNTLAAGVIASVSAGNEGGTTNNPDDVKTPGNCPPPWLNPDQTLIGGVSAIVCVGSTNSSDSIADSSSRGPSTWETVNPYNDYPFNPEMGLLKPDVSAPGVDIISCDAFNINGYITKSGTSMATPGVAGIMALLLSRNPSLTPEDLCRLLETTSLDLGAIGKDNVFGAGRVDAIKAITSMGMVYETHEISDPNENGEVEANEAVLLTITLNNASDMDYSDVEVSISCNSQHITVTDALENYGDFTAGESKVIVDGFTFDVSEYIQGQETLRFNITATSGNTEWQSSFEIISYGPNPYIGDIIIDDATGNGNGRLELGEQANLIFDIYNNGQIVANTILLTLSDEGNNLNIENNEFTIELLEPGEKALASFSITVAEDTPPQTTEVIRLSLQNDPFYDFKEFFLILGLIVEDWETGDFSKFNWTFSGDDWFICDIYPYENDYCIQSVDIDNNSQTDIILNYEVNCDDSISFYKKVSSEVNYDKLRFYIDNVVKGSWSGEVAWSMEKYEVTAGNHTFKWEYSKDREISSGSDAAWVDFVVLPPHPLPSIILDSEENICEGDQYFSSAQVENYEFLLWTTSGDGSFDNSGILDAIYTPGTSDIMVGNIQLTLTAYGTFGNVFSFVNLFINELPVVELGNDTIIYLNHEITLSAGNDGAVYNWSTGESSQTIVVDSSGLNGEIEKQISVLVSNIFGCSWEDQILISFQNNSGLGELAQLKNLSIYPNPNRGEFNIFMESLAVQDVRVEIVNLMGTVVYEDNWKLKQGSMLNFIDISELPAQTYLLILKTSKGALYLRIIIM